MKTNCDIFYTWSDTQEQISLRELKQNKLDLYHSLTSYRYLLRNIAKQDVKGILKSILESNTTYLMIGYSESDLGAILGFSKLEFVNILMKHEFTYGLTYMDYDDYVLKLEFQFKEPIEEFKGESRVDWYLSYDDLKKIVPYIKMDNAMKENWDEIKHWWDQKEKFKDLD